METVFWASVVVVAYVYVGYPLLLAAWAALALAGLYVHARAFADLTSASPPRGLYWGVTWNMSDAWQAAARAASQPPLPALSERQRRPAGTPPAPAS